MRGNKNWDNCLTTLKCNQNCLNCIHDREQVSMIEMNSLDTPGIKERIKKKIDDFGGGENFGITGGEPTIAPYFFEVLRYVRKKHKTPITVVTNGRMFSYQDFIKKLNVIKGLEPFRVGISLYGHNKRLHNTITRTEGSFEQTVEGIRKLLKNGYKVELRIIVNKLNYKHSLEIAKFIKENFPDVLRVIFIHMKYTGNAYKNRELIGVRITEANPSVIEAVDYLEENEINVKLFHFPLCTIPERHWGKAEGITKKNYHVELCFADACENCSKKDVCPRIWKTYKKIYGNEEFKEIKD